MEEIGNPVVTQNSLFSSATMAKLILVGLALATGIGIGVGTTSLYYQNSISSAALTPTPVIATISVTPIPTISSTAIPTMQVINPTLTFDQRIMNKDGIITCTSNVDCAKTCDQKTIDMYGNNSHCPIAQCINGQCHWQLVP